MKLAEGNYKAIFTANAKKKTVDFTIKKGEVKKISVNFIMQKLSNSIGMKFVYIKPGSFNMGSNNGDYDEKPVHRVTLSKGFYMQTTEVTQKQWRSVMGNNPSHFKNCDDCPVESVSWNDAKDFIRKLNSKEGTNKYQLPTEVEWEYTCRAGSDTDYAGGNSLGVMGWYKNNSGKTTHSVARKKANALGLFDMHGNVWEWVEDSYDYKGGVVKYTYRNIIKTPMRNRGSDRVSRGGSWYGDASRCRSADRDFLSPGYKYYNLGYRLSKQL